jgi:hypothetical protein
LKEYKNTNQYACAILHKNVLSYSDNCKNEQTLFLQIQCFLDRKTAGGAGASTAQLPRDGPLTVAEKHIRLKSCWIPTGGAIGRRRLPAAVEKKRRLLDGPVMAAPRSLPHTSAIRATGKGNAPDRGVSCPALSPPLQEHGVAVKGG